MTNSCIFLALFLGECGAWHATSLSSSSENIWKVTLPCSFCIPVQNLRWLWIPIDQAGIFLMLPSVHPPSNLCTLQQGQATEKLLLSVSSLVSLQSWGLQMGTWTGVLGNQQPDPAQPITQLHVTCSKSPINWSDCPVDWKRGLWVSVFACVHFSPWAAFFSS